MCVSVRVLECVRAFVFNWYGLWIFANVFVCLLVSCCVVWPHHYGLVSVCYVVCRCMVELIFGRAGCLAL